MALPRPGGIAHERRGCRSHGGDGPRGAGITLRVSERRDDGHKNGFCRPSAALHSPGSRNRLKSFALDHLVSWAGWTPANHRRNPVIIKATAIARFSARHSDARNLVVATGMARSAAPKTLP